MKKFNALIEQLQLQNMVSIEEKLTVLSQWCHQNISSNIAFSEEPQIAYEKYQQLAEFYLDSVLPNIPENLAENSPLFDNQAPIHFLATAGFNHLLQELHPAQSIVNTRNRYGMTALHIAAIKGDYYTVETLCNLGADLKLINKGKAIPLFSALMLPTGSTEDKVLRDKKLKIFNLLKNFAPDTLTHQDESGNTVLHLIATAGFSSAIQDVLQTVPELFTIKNYQQNYPIHTAILNNQLACLEIFLTRKDSKELVNAEGQTALHYAALYGSEAMVSLCCSVFENINLPDHEGRTPLMLAASTGNSAAMGILVNKGANANLTDNYGNTVLHHAIHFHSISSLTWVLKNLSSIDINAQNNDGKSALKLCEIQRQTNKINLLQENGATERATLRK